MDLTQYLPFAAVALGLPMTVSACFRVSQKSNLKKVGIPVDGIVCKQSDRSASNVNEKITIRFLTKEQEWITGPIDQGFELFYTGQYKNGDPVKVFYNPDKPTEFYVDTKQSVLLVRIIGCVTGICLTVFGLLSNFRVKKP